MMDVTQAAPVMRPMGGFLALTLIFVAAEYVYARLSHHDEDHDLAETAASIGVALGDLCVRILTGGLAALPFVLLYRHRLFDIPLNSAWSWARFFSAPSSPTTGFTAPHTGCAGCGRRTPCITRRRISICRRPFASAGRDN